MLFVYIQNVFNILIEKKLNTVKFKQQINN